MQITRQHKVAAGVVVAIVAIIAIFAAIMHSIERAILLAPVLVVAVGVGAGLILFWGRVAIMQIRGEDTFRSGGGRRGRRGAPGDGE